MIEFIFEKICSRQFDLIVSQTNESNLFELDSHAIRKVIHSTKSIISINPVVIAADPFLYSRDNCLYLFYEEQINFTGKGLIKMCYSKDLISWSKPTIVLEEPFHLSYPYVFNVEGDVYMMPETGNSNTIRLYRPSENFTTWEYHNTLLTGAKFVDSSIIYHNDYFYLFTTILSENQSILKIFYSESLEGSWIEHPLNPIRINSSARCAGAVFKHGDSFYRPAQRADGYYGSGVDVFRINNISPIDYEEVLFREKIIPCDKEIYKDGGHHFACLNYNGIFLTATDVVVRRIKILEVLKRIKNKFV